MRYSLINLFGLMAFVAFGLGALAGASTLMASSVFTATVLAFCATATGLFLTTGRTRAFCLGFLVFGGAHALLTLAPWLDEHTGKFMLSYHAIQALGAAMGHGQFRNSINEGVLRGLRNYVAGSPPFVFLTFVLIGQCWFSIAIGWLGGLAASYFARKPHT